MGTFCVVPIALALAIRAPLAEAETMRIVTTDLGPMGYGTNMFRCGLVHSSGAVFLGTYGPPPGIVWRYDPTTGELTRVTAPGEYQLDCVVEAPDGMIYIGSAYNGLVYRLDPATGEVTSLGSPPVDSTPWIFTMIRTSRGEVYGAKGVGLFRLNWREQRLEAIGVVPGDHNTVHPARSSPITRQLEEAPDGTIWGDTNRWLFRFHLDTGLIEPLVDMAQVDPACYALFLPSGRSSSLDAHFCLYSRFSGQAVRDRLYVCRAGTGRIAPVPLPELVGDLSGHPAWWTEDGRTVLLMQTWEEQSQRAHIASVDPETGQVLGEWSRSSHEPGGNFLVGPNGELYFFTFTRLFRCDAGTRRLVEVAKNPTPVECRCLAMSPTGVLGTDTYDLGYAFTLDPSTGESRDHGKVWADDHRANYGPAVFAGRRGRYLLANHGESTPALWVTDTQTNRHWRVGETAVQLVRFRDGSVWGTHGPNPPSLAFDPATCWTPVWQARSGSLFRYVAGEREVEQVPQLGSVGPIAEAPGTVGGLLAAAGRELLVYDTRTSEVSQRIALPDACIAAAGGDRRRAYLLLADGTLSVCRPKPSGSLRAVPVARDFGPADRGFFALHGSGTVAGVSTTGEVSLWQPGHAAVTRIQASAPPPAGPAVDPEQNAWCFAHRSVTRYTLEPTAPSGQSAERRE